LPLLAKAGDVLHRLIDAGDLETARSLLADVESADDTLALESASGRALTLTLREVGCTDTGSLVCVFVPGPDPAKSGTITLYDTALSAEEAAHVIEAMGPAKPAKKRPAKKGGRP
jgi:hypothetical protein